MKIKKNNEYLDITSKIIEKLICINNYLKQIEVEERERKQIMMHIGELMELQKIETKMNFNIIADLKIGGIE